MATSRHRGERGSIWRLEGFPADWLPDKLLEPIQLTQPIQLKARSSEVLIVTQKGASPCRPSDPALIKAVVRAHHWHELITKGKVTGIEQIARQEGLAPRYVRRILNLGFLAPDIIEEILHSESPPTLMQQELQKGVPASWREQRKRLGFRQNPARKPHIPNPSKSQSALRKDIAEKTAVSRRVYVSICSELPSSNQPNSLETD